MRKLLPVLVVAALAVAAPTASAAANAEQAPCIALFTSNQPAGEVGQSASSSAQEARPFGLIVVSFSAHLRSPCGE
jgi:putative cell wall-binding protein